MLTSSNEGVGPPVGVAVGKSVVSDGPGSVLETVASGVSIATAAEAPDPESLTAGDVVRDAVLQLERLVSTINNAPADHASFIEIS